MGLGEGRWDCKVGEGVEKDQPIREDNESSEGDHRGEEARSLGACLAGGLPRRLEHVKNRVPRKRQKIQRREHHRQIFFAMPEIMLKFISVIFHNIERLVLDFPARPTIRNDLGDVLFSHR